MTTPEKPKTSDGYDACGVQKRQGKGVCTQRAGWGTDHPGDGPCKLHGGNFANVRTKYQRINAQRALERFCDPNEWDTSLSPDEALVEEVHRTRNQVMSLEVMIEEADTLEQTVLMGEGGSRVDLTVAADLLHKKQQHLVNVTKAAIGAGIAERRLQLDEKTADAILGVLKASLKDLGVEETPEVREIVARHLRAVG